MLPPPLAGQTPLLTRRRLLHRLGVGALVLAPAARLLAATAEDERRLAFVHTHTREELNAVYYQGGRYLPNALLRLNELLRDFRTEEVHPIDPQLLDQLYALQCRSGSNGAFEIISAFRSPKTNARLHARSSGVAEKSLHLEGKAIDVRLPGFATRKLAVLARLQQGGGVGFYKVSDFVHIDTGRARIWGDPV